MVRFDVVCRLARRCAKGATTRGVDASAGLRRADAMPSVRRRGTPPGANTRAHEQSRTPMRHAPGEGLHMPIGHLGAGTAPIAAILFVLLD